MLTTREAENVVVCDLAGRLDTHSADDIGEQLLGLVNAGQQKLLLNLAQLVYVSSIGLRILVQAAKAAKASGGVLKVCAPTPTVMKVLELSALEHLLDVTPDEAAALQRF